MKILREKIIIIWIGLFITFACTILFGILYIFNDDELLSKLFSALLSLFTSCFCNFLILLLLIKVDKNNENEKKMDVLNEIRKDINLTFTKVGIKVIRSSVLITKMRPIGQGIKKITYTDYRKDIKEFGIQLVLEEIDARNYFKRLESLNIEYNKLKDSPCGKEIKNEVDCFFEKYDKFFEQINILKEVYENITKKILSGFYYIKESGSDFNWFNSTGYDILSCYNNTISQYSSTNNDFNYYCNEVEKILEDK